MANDDIDLDRVLIDPSYRREVIDYLNASARDAASGDGVLTREVELTRR